MAALTVTTLAGPSVVKPALAAASGGGDTVAVDGGSDRVWLEANNASGGSLNVILADPGLTPAGNASTGTTVAVAAGTTRLIPIPAGLVNPTTGAVSITYSGVTSLTVGAFKR